ncbi:MAG: ATP-binding cassette domain-containing protein [Acidimicrobiales bacterium]
MSNSYASGRRADVPVTLHSSAAADDRLVGRRRREQPPPSPATAGSTALAVEARGVRKSFGDQVVLDGIDLEVPEGAVFALLGPNGSGKTTTVRILSTLLAADAGTIRVAGYDVVTEADSVRGAIGVTGQFSAVDGLLSGRENLELMADLNHLDRRAAGQRIAALLERFDLADAAGKPARTYSGGMRRRLDLAMTLVGRPRIIFLDEPTTGLDPRGRHAMWELIRALVADEGVTILLTTQYLDEADPLADRIAVLDHGVLVAEGTPAELKARVPGGHIRLGFSDSLDLDCAARLLSAPGRDDETLSLTVPSDGAVATVRAVLAQLETHDVEVESLSIHTPDLDDVFFAVTGRPSTGQSSTGQSSTAQPSTKDVNR